MIGNRGDMSAFSESFVREDVFMQQARNTAEELGTVDPSPAVGGLLKYVVQTLNAKSIAEIGTGSGVSGLWIFNGAASDAVLTSIDTEREHAAAARTVFEEAEIGPQRFRLITGVILEVVGKLADNNYDLIVLRPAADLMDLIHESYRLLRTGGVLFIDHALSGGKVADPTQRDFESISRRDGIKAVKEDSRWSSSLLPVGSGVLLATKL
ncbi:MAG: class I SAM-dependent methyltransferase [Actinomycetes bacterium]|jgi:predicted O-methyltransferase YrrM